MAPDTRKTQTLWSLRPYISQINAVFSKELVARFETSVEPCREDNTIHWAFSAIVSNDTIWSNHFDWFIGELDSRKLQTGTEINWAPIIKNRTYASRKAPPGVGLRHYPLRGELHTNK